MKQMRATLGALPWRATQTCPWLAAGVSLLQGKQKSPCVEDLLETKKLIRMQHRYADTPLKFSSQIKQPILVTYTDASWACRADGSSLFTSAKKKRAMRTLGQNPSSDFVDSLGDSEGKEKRIGENQMPVCSQKAEPKSPAAPKPVLLPRIFPASSK